MGLKERLQGHFQRHYDCQEEQLRECSDEELIGEMGRRNRETAGCIAAAGLCIGGLVAAPVCQETYLGFVAVGAMDFLTTTGAVVGGQVIDEERKIIREIAEERGFTKVEKGFFFDKIEK